jgi:glycerol kinase
MGLWRQRNVFWSQRVTGVAELADAVLQGVAHSVADIVKAVQNDTSIEITSLMVDGKMAQSDLLLRYTSAFSEVEVRRSKQLEATSLGAGTLAQHATEGVFDKPTSDPRENLVGETFIPTSVVTASAGIDELRAQWARAKELSKQQIPALSAIRFS